MLQCIPFKSERMQQCRRSESILSRKMARAVTSVDLPFKIQFKCRCRLYKFLVTVALVLARSHSIVAESSKSRWYSRNRGRRRRVKLWFPNESNREYSSTILERISFFPPYRVIVSHSLKTTMRKEWDGFVKRFRETFRFVQKRKVQLDGPWVWLTHRVYLWKLRITRANRKRETRFPSISLITSLLVSRQAS